MFVFSSTSSIGIPGRIRCWFLYGIMIDKKARRRRRMRPRSRDTGCFIRCSGLKDSALSITCSGLKGTSRSMMCGDGPLRPKRWVASLLAFLDARNTSLTSFVTFPNSCTLLRPTMFCIWSQRRFLFRQPRELNAKCRRIIVHHRHNS